MSAMARPFENKSSLDDLLPAAQAFSLLPVERNGDTLHLSWNIATGYYLYRNRIRAEALTPSPRGLCAIRIPQGTAHADDHFGSVQLYRVLLAADVPPSGKTQSQPP